MDLTSSTSPAKSAMSSSLPSPPSSNSSASPSTGSERRENTSVLRPRLILLTLLFTTLLLPSLLQPALTALYTHLYHSPLYRFSGFETLETIFCYAFIEILFTYKFGKSPNLRIDVRGPHVRQSNNSSSSRDVLVDDGDGGSGKTEKRKQKVKVPKMKRPSKRMGEMLIYAAPLLLMDFTMIKKFAGVPVEDIRASGGYDPVMAHVHPGADQNFVANQPLHLTSDNASAAPFLLQTSTTTTDGKSISPSFLLPTLHNFTFRSPLQLTRALPPPQPHPPTPRRLTLELLTSLLIYDSLFFLLHLSLHRLPFLSPLHLPHHSHTEIHPQITNRLTVFERLSLVLLANFSLNVIGSHVLTRTLFVPVFVYLLVEVHSGLDLEWGYEKVLPARWGSGAKVHARHHRSGTGGLAPFFMWWDRALERWDGWWAGRRERETERVKEL